MGALWGPTKVDVTQAEVQHAAHPCESPVASDGPVLARLPYIRWSPAGGCAATLHGCLALHQPVADPQPHYDLLVCVNGNVVLTNTLTLGSCEKNPSFFFLFSQDVTDQMFDLLLLFKAQIRLPLYVSSRLMIFNTGVTVCVCVPVRFYHSCASRFKREQQ